MKNHKNDTDQGKKIKNLFVVDWKNVSSDEINRSLKNAELPGFEWSYYNCQAKTFLGGGFVFRYITYIMAVFHIIRIKSKYDNIVIWQPMIGFVLSFLPKKIVPPKIIISSILYSPARVKFGSFRLYLLKLALKRSDALLYFSEDMAGEVSTVYPQYSEKIFSTYLPIPYDAGNSAYTAKLKDPITRKASVFSGGLSDRDFETVIRAFTNTDVPVTIVCANTYIFKEPSLITNNFTIVRGVSEMEYHSHVLASSFLVVALKNEFSSCGQLLFTFCMKNRIPIIASDCYGTRDYISNNVNGILVPIKDDKAIFNAYNKLADDAAYREKLIQRSSEIAEKMTFDNYLSKLDSIIQQIK